MIRSGANAFCRSQPPAGAQTHCNSVSVFAVQGPVGTCVLVGTCGRHSKSVKISTSALFAQKIAQKTRKPVAYKIRDKTP